MDGNIKFKEDCELKICMPRAEDLDKLSNTWIRNVRAYTMNKDGVISMRTYHKYAIPMYWWEPMAKWIETTQWSPYGLCDGIDGTPKQYMRATWAELALLCQLQTGFRIRDNLDLASIERAFKSAFRRLLNAANVLYKGKKMSVKKKTRGIWYLQSILYLV